jgi:hypothetical protein
MKGQANCGAQSESKEAPLDVELVAPGRWIARLPGGFDLPLSAEGSDHRPRVRDLDLAGWLGFDRPRKVRDLIKRMVKEGKLRGLDVRPTVGRSQTPTGGVREITVNEFWLTREQTLLVATQSDTPRAWELTELMVRVFDAVMERQRPVATAVDGPAMAAMVRSMMVEASATLRAEILMEIRSAQPANVADAVPFLDRRARSMVLAPIMVVARTYAGPGADQRRVMQERGRLDKKLRDALGWQRRWCFYPSHDFGRVASMLESELSIANRIASELMRARQLSLVPAPRPPSRGDA